MSVFSPGSGINMAALPLLISSEDLIYSGVEEKKRVKWSI